MPPGRYYWHPSIHHGHSGGNATVHQGWVMTHNSNNTIKQHHIIHFSDIHLAELTKMCFGAALIIRNIFTKVHNYTQLYGYSQHKTRKRSKQCSNCTQIENAQTITTDDTVHKTSCLWKTMHAKSNTLALLHCDPKKNTPKCFCHIFYKMRPILIKYGTCFPD